ncbi:hypothetical protein Clacol_004077 [Clathrus columnatus]|uniref:ABC transporter n=1 Tax=Clathrus columnatus TaxID=1419009 RepID=A0AAV5AB50_9AGAM|nr:hypothetical protein Clacol_004077 [Clathrus columnatus]
MASKHDLAVDDSSIDDGEKEKKLSDVVVKPPMLKYDEVPWYKRVPFASTKASPPPESLDTAPMIPEASASIFSIITFNWMASILSLGYARPLEPTDLWKLQDNRSAAVISEKILTSFEKRVKAADEYNARLKNGEISPGWRALWWAVRGDRVQREKNWREKTGRKKPSLSLALNDSVFWWFWSAGIFKVTGDTAQVTSPLIVKAIINFATASFTAHNAGEPAPGIGKGVGLAFALLALQLLSSACTHQFFYRSASTGVLLRGGLIHAIYSRSLRYTSRARSTLTNGKLVNHISTDVSRIDFCASWFHMFWAAPIQMCICLALLLVNLGPSALAGFALFLIGSPIQTKVMKRLFAIRKKSMVFTDKRAKLLQELFGNMRIIKLFAWEDPFLKKISELRNSEVRGIRSLLLIRAANNAGATSLPALAAVLAFVVYSLTGHTIEPAVIFTSLTLFNLLRLPLMFLPLSASANADAMNAVHRLEDAFTAELRSENKIIDNSLPYAIIAENANFSWDGAPPDMEDNKKGKKNGKKSMTQSQSGKKMNKSQTEKGTVTKVDVEGFKVKDVNLTIPRGQLCAIVGPVGSGKSSLLQGLIGEMRRESGTVQFGGSVGYCQQSAWIQNATVRENICFGRPFEEDRYWRAVRDSCLGPDLDMLPHGDQTEVGEKGISLSGGQKQRLNICRALYCDTDIQIFDDPLSALDAHVGKAVFHNVFKNALHGKTRILVTHALHFLPHVDYIITMLDGRVVERGTYQELMDNKGSFAKFFAEFGAKNESEEKDQESSENESKMKKGMAGGQIMQAEERSTGAVSNAVYRAYFAAAKGEIWLPLLFASLAILQGAQVMNSYWLVYWQEMKWNKPQGFYMGIYAGFGIAQALGFFFMGTSFAFMSYFASSRLHRAAVRRVMHAPMSFFDTTSDSLRMFMGTFSSILGAIILIAIIVPYFLVPVAFILAIYFYAALFYRSSARELKILCCTKRLDAILRSVMYSHFSESLSGMATIRAYGESERFLKENEVKIDIENRAYWLTVANQRWLGIRLDFLGILLTFTVAILTVAARFTISPSQTGVTLSYILTVQQAFGFAVRQSAEVENNMNGVERIVYYANEIEQDGEYERPNATPPPEWPANGTIEFKNVEMSYRPGLPTVLKGLTMSVKGGEKIGIVGRTGAGKSSIMTALFRLVELKSGSITVDDIDISTLGLRDLRSHLSNDARLWDALKRAYLVENTKANESDEDVEVQNKFTLDTVIEDEGGNLSVGQRSLVSLARALVKDSRILILDEATASVDFETDSKIQKTIAEEFNDRTILCIAHRLKTIIGYDKICVLDAGMIAEFATPTELYKAGGIFRSMCDRSGISLEDIRYAVKEREGYE